MKLLNIFMLVLVLNLSESLKILGFFGHPGKSHMDMFHPLMTGLSKKGHNVTTISYIPLKSPIPRYREIILNKMDPLVHKLDLRDFNSLLFRGYFTPFTMLQFGKDACQAAYESESLKASLNSNETFDLVITELFTTDCFLPVVHKFRAPVVGISSSTLMPWTGERFANPTHPAYIPVNLLRYSDRMSFFERVENTLYGVFTVWLYENYFLRRDRDIIKKYLGDDDPPLEDLKLDMSVVLVNSHYTLNLPRPLVPGIIEVGGIHVENPKKLPNDLDRWINESTHGVIYFSLGSMIKGHTFPAEKRQEFLRAFGRLPQRILWKWENDTMPGKPDNVMIQKWMPQLDILCHPNVKAFISHGGLLGTTEAVHCGVPIVVMPQFGDQFTNARALEEVGGGVILDLHTATEDKVYDALRTVLQPSFRKGAEELSARFRDRPLPPLETAIYWVEYVARHRGAHHMRTAAVGMPIYKYLLLDVIAFLVIVLAAISAVTFVIARAVLRKIFVKKNKAKTD